MLLASLKIELLPLLFIKVLGMHQNTPSGLRCYFVVLATTVHNAGLSNDVMCLLYDQLSVGDIVTGSI